MPQETVISTRRDNYIYSQTHWIYGLERNQRVWRILHKVLAPIMRRRLDFSCKQFRIRSKKFLVVANHVTDYDPIMLGIMFPKYLRFVCTEKLLRARPWGSILSWLFNPIPWRKGGITSDAAEYIKTNLKLGINVAMFPEDERTMNGRSGSIQPGIGQLIKEADGSLITVRLARGYMISPLWATERRKGPTSGRIVREYSREELNEMSAEEIEDAVTADIRYNVWEDLDSHRTDYRSKAAAEGLENALYVCPRCERIGTMIGNRSDFICTCGHSVSVDRYGYFTDHDAPFENILEWDIWQRNYIASQIKHWQKNRDEAICHDRGISLVALSGRKQKGQLGNATMTLHADRIQFSAVEPLFSFRLSDIEKMSSHGGKALLFTYQGRYYEITKRTNWPLFKYISLWKLLTEKAEEDEE